ncbi:hypothetical protein BGW36DRAFT_453063 [Talaromyces proteolyticus]|uniref:Zn(2)-C6 fungal-type domain-containing protein n=1 Tax=Talaromyces proteolyticus TaxID=1131652 RepID=A0AAD4PZ11_9EURO|nr:uncharacterized protein BGW36DRAFT_453063 [Talaromyces proteolyticus]KAH8695189.1 hypothetical protein BGW36DRAFT_453063 [Talaromyces proteolyticus]
MPVQKRAPIFAQGSRVRRQNHSCDQCRKSKRACDALCPDLTRQASFSNVDGRRLPCSYCARTKKRCTMEWALLQTRPALKTPGQESYSENLMDDLLSPWKTGESRVGVKLGKWADLDEPNSMQELMTWEPANLDLTGSLVDYGSMLPSSIFSDNESFPEEMQADMPATSTSAGSLSDLLLSGISTQQSSDSQLDPMWPTFQGIQNSQEYSSLQPISSKPPQQPSDSTCMSFNQPSSSRNSPRSPLSPFSIDQQMITTYNYHLTSTNLLQIYHDVLEHNLSCWLTEMTCPYQLPSRKISQIIPEWGSSWSNRIYQRTIKLDRVAQASNFLQLTRSEDQAASKALHLAIMSFATQWAQGSQRQQEKYPTNHLNHENDDISGGITSEFDRILQNQFWDQAHRALQDVADVESYRVACAELIFGLTQRPWNSDNQNHGHLTGENDCKFTIDLVLGQLRDIIHKEGPPIYIERAARKMHSLKFRCDILDKGLGSQYGSQEKGVYGTVGFNCEDRATIGLLYWLAIMFDTVSSSMNERPVVVLDEDCQHEAQKGIQQAATIDKSLARNRWNLELFVQGSLKEAHAMQWPCTYEAAAKDVVKSAPVKVLLFRHLSYLQNAVRKSSHEEQIEDIIHSTRSLYEYWNKTHGAFFRQLVQNYSAIPLRIQGWFVCISAHWHLAALMFADLLEFIDENALGMEDAACNRINSQIARKIRRHSAMELSDLARVATPTTRDTTLGVPQMPGFHQAVNEGTLLTEPWTMILIRAFTKACVVFLSEADQSLRLSRTTYGHSSLDFERNMEQAEYCIKGQWLLGKKSDMARNIAETLSRALGKLRNEYVK